MVGLVQGGSHTWSHCESPPSYLSTWGGCWEGRGVGGGARGGGLGGLYLPDRVQRSCTIPHQSPQYQPTYHFSITMHDTFSQSEARSRLGQGEGTRQNRTWSCPSHHRDHYLSKPQGAGGGGGGGGSLHTTTGPHPPPSPGGLGAVHCGQPTRRHGLHSHLDSTPLWGPCDGMGDLTILTLPHFDFGA